MQKIHFFGADFIYAKTAPSNAAIWDELLSRFIAYLEPFTICNNCNFGFIETNNLVNYNLELITYPPSMCRQNAFVYLHKYC